MATTYKVLGQVAPDATTDTTLYTVPSATQAVISSLVVANRGGLGDTFRIAVRPSGATLANEHYIAYDVPISANDSTTLTLGLTLQATDVVTVYCVGTAMSFSAFGSEITA